MQTQIGDIGNETANNPENRIKILFCPLIFKCYMKYQKYDS